MYHFTFKRILLFVIVIFISTVSFSQVIIKEAGIKFNLNDTLWKLYPSSNENIKDAIIYRYKRVPIETRDGKHLTPLLTIIIEPVPDSMDIMVFSATKKMKTPFDIEDVFMSVNSPLKFENAIGYRGGYTDRLGLRHSLIIIYLINQKKGVQLIMDINRQLYDEYRGEFDEVIRSVQAIQ